MSEPSTRWRPSPYLVASALLHLSAAAGLLVRPGDWPGWVAALGLDHGGLALGGLLPRSSLLGPNVRRVPISHLQPDEVVLTFDDGPDPVITPRVLDLLDIAECSASFFCIGRRASQFGDVVKETVRRGHAVENHSFNHSNAFAFHGPRSLGREIDLTQDVLRELSGVTPGFFRAPAGIRGVCLAPVMHRRRMTLVSWTRRGFDTIDRDPERVSRRLSRRIKPGDVLVLHDGSSCLDRRGEPVVLEALKRVLDQLEARGLKAVGLPASLRSG